MARYVLRQRRGIACKHRINPQPYPIHVAGNDCAAADTSLVETWVSLLHLFLQDTIRVSRKSCVVRPGERVPQQTTPLLAGQRRVEVLPKFLPGAIEEIGRASC